MKDLYGFIEGFGGSFAELLPEVPAAVIGRVEMNGIPGVAKLVIGEAHNFPELARVWRKEVLVPMFGAITKRIRMAQKAGEVTEGPPELFAMLIASPIILTLLFREAFGAEFAPSKILAGLPNLHGQILVRGMLLGEQSSALSPNTRTSRKK